LVTVAPVTETSAPAIGAAVPDALTVPLIEAVWLTADRSMSSLLTVFSPNSTLVESGLGAFCPSLSAETKTLPRTALTSSTM